MKNLYRLCHSIIFLALLQAAQAQQPDLVFHHLTEKDGLSYNIVNCFFKDSRGMLWIGTYNGLNRYDGAHFYIFRKGRDKNSLPNNTVHELAEDKKGNIWGATDEGVFCYDQQKNSFKNYHTPREGDWPGVVNILCDKAGDIWVSNRLGLVKFNAVADSFELAPSASPNIQPEKGYYINKNGMAESPDGKALWISSVDGLLYYDKTTHEYTSKQNNTDSVLFAARHASGLCATTFGHYWYFDNVEKRLVGFDPINKKVKYAVKPKEFDNIYYVATVFEDNNHVLWICTWGYQIYRIDYLNSDAAIQVKHNNNDRSSIIGDFFWAAMHESDGTLWLGTVGGISRCNTNHSFYKVHHFPDSLFGKPNPAIEFVSENAYDATWWITTTKRGLLHYDPATSGTVFYDFGKIPVNKKGLHPAHVNRMLFSKDRILMFSDYGAWMKIKNAAFEPLQLPSVADSVLFRDGALVNDSIVYCSDRRRLWRWNINSNQVNELEFKKKFSINGAEPLTALLTPVGQQLWMLNGYDWLSYVKDKKMIPVKFSSVEKDGGNGFYTSMAADKKGNLWMAKKGDGLFYYSTTENKYQQFKQYDGLVMDHIMSVSADNSGKIWTAAYNQFSVYNPLLNSFYNFTLPLSTNNYTYMNFMTTLANGNVICNVADQIVEFYPGRLRSYSANTLPIISTLSVSGIEKLLPGSKLISLAPDENSLLIKFGLLADNEASPYDMLYTLEGAEKNWTVAGNNFEASYNMLQPGNYTFKVKALAKDKSWQTKETILKVTIARPFYKTWWFISILALMVAACIYAFYRYRLQQQQQVINLESKAQLLEKEKTHVLYESLKQQLNPHFLFNSLTSLSGLIETDQQMAGTFLDQMSKTYRYILKSSDSETVPLKDEIAFVKLYIRLQQTRFKEGLVVDIDIPAGYDHYKIAPVTLQNMIENAIKHNVIDTDSPLEVKIFVEDECLVIKNNLQKKSVVETSNRKGLENLKSLYRYLTARPVIIEETVQHFLIKIPLL